MNVCNVSSISPKKVNSTTMPQCLFKQCNNNKMENPKYFKFLQKKDTLSLWLNRLKVKFADDKLCENCFVCSDHFRALMENCNLKELPSDVLPNYVDAANADKDLSTYDSFTLDHSLQRVNCKSDSICLTDGKAKKNVENYFFSVPSRKQGDRPIRLRPRKLLFDDDDDASLSQTNRQKAWINKRKKLSNENERNFKRSKSEMTDDGSSNLNSIKLTGNEMEIFDEDQMDNSNLLYQKMFSDQISQQSATEQRNQINPTSIIKLTPFRQFSNEKIKTASSSVSTVDVYPEPNIQLQTSSSLPKFQDEIRKTATDMRNVSKRFREETAMCTSTNKRTFSDMTM